MIEGIFYSIASKKANKDISAALEDLKSFECTPKKEVGIIEHTLQVAEKGRYPDVNYYSMFYKEPAYITTSKSEILLAFDRTKDFYQRERIKEDLIEAINETNSTETLVEKLSTVVGSVSKGGISDFEDFGFKTYSDYDGIELPEGYKIGISEIDSVTSGWQRGNMAAICAFTGGGKTTLMLSAVYKSAMRGEKNLIFSLEMAPNLLQLMLQARYLYEEKSLEITQEDLIQHKLTKEMAAKVKEYDEDYRRDVGANVLILDETFLPQRIVTDYRLLNNLYDKVESYLGGLDCIAVDHAHQIELMYRDMGNAAIRTFMSSCKTWKNSKGFNPVTIMLAQVNREGFKRACKRGGVYDLAGIGNLNEIERSSSYVMFLHTTDDSKIVQETKVTLTKNRLGKTIPEPVVTTFNPAVVLVGNTEESINADEMAFGDMMSDFGADIDF